MSHMAMMSDEKKMELYGPDRNKHANRLRKTLNEDHVLQSGEYNLNSKRLGDDVWKTTHSFDFTKNITTSCNARPTNVDGEGKPNGKIQQLETHFQLGNESGKDLPSRTYQMSTTKDDFDPKGASRPHVRAADSTVYWSDMAPQFARDRSMGSTDYRDTYTQAGLLADRRRKTLPLCPKINTAKVALPILKNCDEKNKTNVILGSDGESFETDTGRAYSHSAPVRGRRGTSLAEEADERLARMEDLNRRMAEARKVTLTMREMGRESHVFRTGDYNNAKQESGSIFTLDYGKAGKTPVSGRLVAPGFVATKRSNTTPGLEDEDKENEVNMADPDLPTDEGLFPKMPKLIEFCLETAVPEKVHAAAQGKKDHLAAHFQLGTDTEKLGSVYYKDYINAASQTVQKPTIVNAPVDSQVLQNDPSQKGGLQRSTMGIEYGSKTFDMAARANDHLQRAAVRNMARRHGNNVVLSYDKNKHINDRQTSLSHNSYLGPPGGFKAMDPIKAPIPSYNYLQTDVALPHPIDKEKTSEAHNQFRGYMMDGRYSIERRRQKDEQTRTRLDHGRGTHFIFGYDGTEYVSEQKSRFSGSAPNDNKMAPAGKVEVFPDYKINHISMSENTEDMTSNPYRVSVMESLDARQMAVARSPPTLPTHKASTMMNDYQPFQKRSFTPAQVMVLDQNNKLVGKPIAMSHLFHTDNSGRSNLETTTMADFIKPETMSGKKYLAAR